MIEEITALINELHRQEMKLKREYLDSLEKLQEAKVEALRKLKTDIPVLS